MRNLLFAFVLVLCAPASMGDEGPPRPSHAEGRVTVRPLHPRGEERNHEFVASLFPDGFKADPDRRPANQAPATGELTFANASPFQTTSHNRLSFGKTT